MHAAVIKADEEVNKASPLKEIGGQEDLPISAQAKVVFTDCHTSVVCNSETPDWAKELISLTKQLLQRQLTVKKSHFTPDLSLLP